MSADFSRQRFDPLKDFSSVLSQQGRVQLDADWNELMEILDRRFRAETIDIIGRAVVPEETPDAFKISVTGGALTIGRGRMYVHGLLAENHGKAPLDFDSILAESRGTTDLAYSEQPYFPNAPSLPTTGTHLVYLDVWEREVTFLEEPGLIEQAVAVDTTARLQTVWQVKFLHLDGASVTCASADNQIPGWPAVIAPSAARLTTAGVGVPPDQDPCTLPPSGGYRGLDNRLYRVEIHTGGAEASSFFKWSRDNASVATTVTGINAAGNTLTVVRTGRDAELRFSTDDWVEITDDNHEWAGLPGQIRKIASVDDPTRTITLAPPALDVGSTGEFPTNAQGQVDPKRHTRLCRWDQKGKVRDSNGNVFFDLDSAGSKGVIPVPAAGTTLNLEDGIQITFSTDAAGGQFLVGDYWVFAARTADASVEPLTQAPPRGVHHHYARLALATFPATVIDCRVLWPPAVSGTGCDCTVCVTAESHNNNTLTIQKALDMVKDRGGKVCLDAGLYRLGPKPLLVQGASSVFLIGQGAKTILLYSGDGPAMVVDSCLGFTLEGVTLLISPGQSADPAPVSGVISLVLRNSLGVTVERCLLVQLGGRATNGLAIGLGGFLFETVLRENFLAAGQGVASLAVELLDHTPRLALEGTNYLFTAGLRIEDNVFWCPQAGIRLDGYTLHALATRISGNEVWLASLAGILATGYVLPSASMQISGNQLQISGDGIRAGTSEALVNDNHILGTASRQQAGDGIVLAPGLNRGGLDHCQVLGNCINGVAGNGIALRTHVRSAMIKQNSIADVGGGGIVMEPSSRADVLSIANNQLLNLGTRPDDGKQPVVGIRLIGTAQAEVAGNTLQGIGLAAASAPLRTAIQVIASANVQIAANVIQDVGPPGEFAGSGAGIHVSPTFEHLTVVGNSVQRNRQPPSQGGGAGWLALYVQGFSEETAAAADPSVGFIPAREGNSLVGFVGNRVLKLVRQAENLSVRGNRFEAYGRSPAVSITANGSCLFTENHCQREHR